MRCFLAQGIPGPLGRPPAGSGDAFSLVTTSPFGRPFRGAPHLGPPPPASRGHRRYPHHDRCEHSNLEHRPGSRFTPSARYSRGVSQISVSPYSVAGFGGGSGPSGGSGGSSRTGSTAEPRSTTINGTMTAFLLLARLPWPLWFSAGSYDLTGAVAADRAFRPARHPSPRYTRGEMCHLTA